MKTPPRTLGAPPTRADKTLVPSRSVATVVDRITREQHVAHLRLRASCSFLQVPGWASVKPGWRAESVGWSRGVGNPLEGSALVLHRRLPRLPRTFAYLPEGPVLDWSAPSLGDDLAALVDHLGGRGAFAVRIGAPVPVAEWTAPTVKAALADPGVRRLDDVPPDHQPDLGQTVVETLRARGWRPPPDTGGFGAGQPRHVFQLPLAGRSEADVLSGMNQAWRRNIARAARAGVQVRLGGHEDLPDFHRLYTETAARDGFTPRPLQYFHLMHDALNGPDGLSAMTLHLAHHEGVLVAAAIGVRVGEHAWYSYGASSTARREVRGSNAVQWQMIRQARDSGAAVHDLRGITPTLDPADSHAGLLRFKVGTGGRAVALAGEWTYPVSRPLTAVFDLYVRRRGGG